MQVRFAACIYICNLLPGSISSWHTQRRPFFGPEIKPKPKTDFLFFFALVTTDDRQVNETIKSSNKTNSNLHLKIKNDDDLVLAASDQ